MEPLSARRTRLKLLLSSYLDACESSGDHARGDKPSSRLLGRNLELWPKGSYRSLERCMDALRVKYPLVYRSLHAVYVEAPNRSPLRAEAARLEAWTDRKAGKAPHVNDRLLIWRAVFGLILLDSAMPRTIHVPKVISENAGYAPADAGQYAKRSPT